jgi:threonyl-tRNA synthetase
VNGSARQRIYGVCWTDQQELDAWRAPQQAMVVSVDERQIEYTQSVTDALRRAGVRANSDVRNEKIADKIRQHRSQAVPYLLVVGEREMAGDFVSLRSGEGENLGQMNIAAACERLRGGTLAREGAAP